MLAYHSSQEVKDKYVARFAQHRALDQVIQGTGFDPTSGRGCFVGCILDDYDHSLFPVELGWPEWLAQLADTIFENIPKAHAPQFGTDLLDAVQPGVDLERARVPFLLCVQRRNLLRLQDAPPPYGEQCRQAVRGVIDWLEQGAEPGSAAESAAESAARSAESAAEYADYAARSARPAARSAEYAARSAEYAARPAAWSAWSAESAWLAAWSAAWSNEAQSQRDDLLSILREL